MKLRKYKSEDCAKIAQLYYETVHSVNAKDYTEDQLNAWATGIVNLDDWNVSFIEHYTVVAMENEIIVGFGDIDKTGYLDRLFVDKNYQGKGIASAICENLENAFSVDKIKTHASITAKPFFEKRGFKVIKEQEVERKGVKLKNFVMEKTSLTPV